MTDIEKLKKELIEQKQSKFPGNIYHVSQVLFAYNSNKIEGSRLTEEQTEMIFETNSFTFLKKNCAFLKQRIC